MFTTLLRRELLENLMTFRFAAATLGTLLLVLANTAVLLEDYERRLADYNTAVKKHRQELHETKIYGEGEIALDRPPNPLSIFNVGLDKRLGNEILIAHNTVPTLWEARMNGSENPFLNLFSSIDLVFIFEVVLSLMTLMFAYDALAGERERGTLRLVLTNPVGRAHVLLAKYVSAMTCMLIALVISLLFALIFVDDIPFYFFAFRRCSPHRWDSPCFRCVSVGVLSHRVAHLHDNAPHEHRVNARYVRLGISRPRLSEPGPRAYQDIGCPARACGFCV